jgi:hypothetical protein
MSGDILLADVIKLQIDRLCENATHSSLNSAARITEVF